MTATRDHLLDAAERLFADHGVEAVSLRDITAAAGANVAAINYHFGSKEKLVLEVFARRLGPINAERLRLLDHFEKRARGRAPKLEHVFFAFVHPVIRTMYAEPEAGASLMRLMGHVHADVNAGLAHLVLSDMQEMLDRFLQATRRAVPELRMPEIFWRSHFAMGALVQTASAAGLLQVFSNGACTVDSPFELSCRLVAFIAGGYKGDPARVRASIEAALPEDAA